MKKTKRGPFMKHRVTALLASGHCCLCMRPSI